MHYFFSGSLALIVSWMMALSLSGCRFGNNVEKGSPAIDPDTGFYATEPQSLEVATFQTGGGSQGVMAPISNIPNLLRQHFTNPSTFVITGSEGPDRRIAQVYAPSQNPKSAFPLYVDLKKNLSFYQETKWTPAWNSNACLIKFTLQVEGVIAPLGTTPPNMPTSIGNVPVKGRLELEATYATLLDGDCAASTQAMYDCYRDVNQCPNDGVNSQQQWQWLAQDTYEFFIQAGAMSVNDILTTETMAFQAIYR